MRILRDASSVPSSPRTAATAMMSLRRYAHADREARPTETDLPPSPVSITSCEVGNPTNVTAPSSARVYRVARLCSQTGRGSSALEN